MILYLSSNENVDLLDYLIEDKKLVIKKLSGQFNLNKFVIHDMRNLTHCTQIVIDLKAITDIEEELINAITAFKTIYNARFIIIAEGLKQGNQLLKKLIDIEVYNLVTAETIENIRKEIEQCIIGDGMIYQDCLKYLIETMDIEKATKFNLKGKNIKIAVAGIMPRIGTTTTAMNLANYIASLGAKVCYIECNKYEQLKMMYMFYDELTNKENVYEYKGVKYYGDRCEIQSDYEFIIYDIGTLVDRNFNLVLNNDINILCSGSKPYEIKRLYNIADKVSNIKMDIVFSFSSYRERIKIKKLMREFEKNYFFLNYSTDLFDGNANKEIYRRILEDYVEEEVQ